MHLLADLARAGHLRQLDSAFARFVSSLDPDSGPTLAVAAAMLSRVEAMGHSCLPLSALCRPDAELFGWTPEAIEQAKPLWVTLPSEVTAWFDAIQSSAVVQTIGLTPDGGEPLVLDPTGDTPRLYLRRYWHDEQAVAAAVRRRGACRDGVDEPLLRRWIDRLFEPATRSEPHEPIAPQQSDPDWQRVACAIAARGRITIITGGPGTGKTTTAARLLALLAAVSPQPAQLRIALAAPTGKAAARLRQSIDQSLQSLAGALSERVDLANLSAQLGPARTLHALLGAIPDSRKFRHHAGNPLAVDLVIVDEASMVHLEMMAALLDALPDAARLVLLGDKDQLASVEAGAVLGDLCSAAHHAGPEPDTARYIEATTGERVPAGPAARSPLASQIVMLRRSRRFTGPIGALARAVNDEADPRQAAMLLQADPQGALFAAERVPVAAIVAMAVSGRVGAPACYRDYLERLTSQTAPPDTETYTQWALDVLAAFDRFRVLCAIRDGQWGVSGLNQAIAEGLVQAGLLKPQTTWYVGRPVMVTRNEPSLGVYNGDVGIVLPAAGAPDRLRVVFAATGGIRSISPSRLAHVETAFATTVHKSQGSEFEHVALVLGARSGPVLTRELLYTGITRARQAFTLISEEGGLLDTAIARVTRRQTGLRDL